MQLIFTLNLALELGSSIGASAVSYAPESRNADEVVDPNFSVRCRNHLELLQLDPAYVDPFVCPSERPIRVSIHIVNRIWDTRTLTPS